MFVHPDAVINTFVDVKIPSADELMKRFGLKEPKGSHPDRVGDELYTHPSNLHDVPAHDKYLHEIAEFAKSLEPVEFESVPSEAQKDAEDQAKSAENTIE